MRQFYGCLLPWPERLPARHRESAIPTIADSPAVDDARMKGPNFQIGPMVPECLEATVQGKTAAAEVAVVPTAFAAARGGCKTRLGRPLVL